jgi:hypothetical protein
LDRTSNSIADFFVNHCGVTIGVKWTDGSSCHWDCLDYVGPGRRSSIPKSRGRYEWRECQGFGCNPR